MKKLLYASILSLFFLGACNDQPKGESDVTKEKIKEQTELTKKGLREFDLSPYELDAIIFIPEAYDGDDRFIQPEIIHNEGEAKWEILIKTDKNWHIVINDWGNEERTVAMEKAEHENQKDIFDFRYEEEGEGYIFYSKVLKSENTTISEQELRQLPNYHFFCVKQINESYITVRSFELGDFRQISVKNMLRGARLMRPIKEAIQS